MPLFDQIRFLSRVVRVFVIRELREQYAGTLLGGAWAFLQPLLLVLIYWWVFGVILALKVPSLHRDGGDYPFVIFLLAGLLPWLAFQDAVNKSATAVLQRAEVLRQGAFPVVAFPLAKCVATHAVFALLILAFLGVAPRFPAVFTSGAVAFVALLYGLQLLFAMGVGLLVSALTVYVRDLPHLLGMLMMALLFLVPILYPLAQVPPEFRPWVWLNPYTPFATGFQSLILEQDLPSWEVWTYAAGLAGMAVLVGSYVFKRLRPGFADVV